MVSEPLNVGKIVISLRCTRRYMAAVCIRTQLRDGRCSNDHLVYPPVAGASLTSSAPKSSPTSEVPCPSGASRLHLSDPPYENYFYSDCRNISTQVVVTSPLPDSNLTIIGPRLLVAWPSGNSGIVAYLQPANGINGTLGISL